MTFCSILVQSTILHLFGRKNSLIWPFFEKLLQKVQSIHCLDLAILRPKKCFFEGTTFLVTLMLRFFIRPPMCTVLGRKKYLIWPFFERLLQRVQSIHCLHLHFWSQKLLFFEERPFWSYWCTILYQSTIVYSLGRKNCLIWHFFEELHLNVQSIHCLYLHSWGQNTDIFEGTTFLVQLFFDSLSEHHCAQFGPKKSAWFGRFSKSCSKKYSLYTVSTMHFWGPETDFSKERLFWSYWCFDTLSEHRCAQFGPKKLLDFAFFRKVAPKPTVYTQSRSCIFDGQITAIFEGTTFLVTLMHDSLSRAPLCTGWAKTNSLIWPFFEKLLQKVQSIHCLVLAFLRSENCFYEVGTFLVILMLRFFIRAPLCTVWAEKICLIWPYFKNLLQKVQSIHSLDLHFWGQKLIISKETIFWSYWLLRILYLSTVVHSLSQKKSVWFDLFSKSCPKKYSLYTVSICIFDVKILFFEVRFFDDILFDSSSEHHCAPFWPKTLLPFALFQKVAPKSTVYTLSRFAFLLAK